MRGGARPESPSSTTGSRYRERSHPAAGLEPAAPAGGRGAKHRREMCERVGRDSVRSRAACAIFRARVAKFTRRREGGRCAEHHQSTSVCGRAGHVERAADRPCRREGQGQEQDETRTRRRRKPRRRRTKRRTRRKTRPTTERRSTSPEPTTLRTGGRIDARTQSNHPGANRDRNPPLGRVPAARLAQTGTSLELSRPSRAGGCRSVGARVDEVSAVP